MSRGVTVGVLKGPGTPKNTQNGFKSLKFTSLSTFFIVSYNFHDSLMICERIRCQVSFRQYLFPLYWQFEVTQTRPGLEIMGPTFQHFRYLLKIRKLIDYHLYINSLCQNYVNKISKTYYFVMTSNRRGLTPPPPKYGPKLSKNSISSENSHIDKF